MDDQDQGARSAVDAAGQLSPTRYHATIEAWFIESFHGTVVSRSTEAINYVRKAVDALKQRLEADVAHAADALDLWTRQNFAQPNGPLDDAMHGHVVAAITDLKNRIA